MKKFMHEFTGLESTHIRAFFKQHPDIQVISNVLLLAEIVEVEFNLPLTAESLETAFADEDVKSRLAYVQEEPVVSTPAEPELTGPAIKRMNPAELRAAMEKYGTAQLNYILQQGEQHGPR